MPGIAGYKQSWQSSQTATRTQRDSYRLIRTRVRGRTGGGGGRKVSSLCLLFKKGKENAGIEVG